MSVDAIYRTPEGDTFVVASGQADAPPVTLLHGSGAIRPRTERVPIFTDVELTRIAAPTLVVVGQKDALLNSVETKQRLEQHAPQVTVILSPTPAMFCQHRPTAFTPSSLTRPAESQSSRAGSELPAQRWAASAE